MKMVLKDQVTILAFEEDFNRMFPYLRIVVFIPPFSTEYRIMALVKQKTVGSLRGQDSGELTITGAMSVRQLEQSMAETYGLGIRLYRKSGKSWLETIFTDDWSLSKQNAEGEALSKNT